MEWGICAVTTSEWIPDDGVLLVNKFSNIIMELASNPDGSRYNSLYITQTSNVYRQIQVYIQYSTFSSTHKFGKSQTLTNIFNINFIKKNNVFEINS